MQIQTITHDDVPGLELHNIVQIDTRKHNELDTGKGEIKILLEHDDTHASLILKERKTHEYNEWRNGAAIASHTTDDIDVVAEIYSQIEDKLEDDVAITAKRILQIYAWCENHDTGVEPGGLSNTVVYGHKPYRDQEYIVVDNHAGYSGTLPRFVVPVHGDSVNSDRLHAIVDRYIEHNKLKDQSLTWWRNNGGEGRATQWRIVDSLEEVDEDRPQADHWIEPGE